MTSSRNNAFDYIASAFVIILAVLAVVLFALGVDWLIFKGLQFVWSAYPLNYWQTVVALAILGAIASLFRSNSTSD